MPTGYNAESYVSLKMCRSSVNFKEGYGYLNIIDQNTFKSLKNKPKIVEYDFLIKPYGNQGNREPVETIGEFCTSCRYKENKNIEKFVITKGNYGNLLSYQTSVNLGIIKNLARTMSIINRRVYSQEFKPMDNNAPDKSSSQTTQSTLLSEENSDDNLKPRKNIEMHLLNDTYKESNISSSLLDKKYITGIKDNRDELIKHYINDIETKYHSRYIQKKQQHSQAESNRPDESKNKKKPLTLFDKFLSPTEKKILRSEFPVDVSDESPQFITVNGQTGQWLNRKETTQWKGDLPLKEYTINECSDPIVVHKKCKETVKYTQQLAVRYLKPSTPEPPGDIVITVKKNRAAPPAPPIILRQMPVRQPTPPPIVIREAPPEIPQAKRKEIRISGKKLPPPPRKVILERLPAIPAKPQPIIIERWLVPTLPKRKVVLIKPGPVAEFPKPRNVIIQWLPPEIKIRTKLIYLGVQRADPVAYKQKYFSED